MIDFLVIGGGIAGLSAAARLSHLGKVTLLEAESGLGYHTSGRSAAMFDKVFGQNSNIALNQASDHYHRTANGGVLSPLGLMLVATKFDDEADVSREMKNQQMQPLSLEVGFEKVPILNPDVVTSLGINEDVWNIDTDLLMQNFAREIRENGGQILMDQRVTKISKTTAGWDIECGSDPYAARNLVNAAGSWVDQIATMAGITPIGVTPYRRSMARIPAPGGHDVTNWPMLHSVGDNWYARRDAGLLLISPMDEDPSEPHDAWPDDLVLAEGLDRYSQVVTEPVTRLESSWAGLRTFVPDRNLVLGPDRNDPSFIWVAAQGGVGFQTSPAASQLVADLVAGRKSELDPGVISALSPARFS